MKHFIKRLLGFSLGPVFGAFISFIQIPIITYFISKAEYGKASLFSSLIVALPNYIYIGLDQAYTREYQEAEDKKQLIQQAALIPMIVGILLFIVSIVFAPEISNWLFDSPEYTYIVLYGGVWVLATIIERFILLSIRMEERAIEFSSFSMILKFNVFVLSMLLIWMGWRDFKVIVYGLIFGQLLGDVVLFWRYRQYLDIRGFKLNRELIKRMLKFGLPLMVAISLTNSLTLVDKIFIKNYTTLEDVAIYGAASTIIAVIGVVKTAFTSFWIPTAYRWHEEQKEIRHFKFVSDAVLFLLTGIFFGLLLFKDLIAHIVVEEAYRDVKYIFGLLAFPQIMYTLSETTNLGIVFSRKTYLNIIVSVLTFLPSMVLNIVLTPVWGYRGAAAASFAAYIMFYFARTYLSNRVGFGFSQVKPTISIIIMSIAAFLNVFELPYIEWYTLGLGLLALVAQWSTVQQAIEIKNDSKNWDFT